MIKHIFLLTIVVIAFSSNISSLKSQNGYEWLNETTSSYRAYYMTLNRNEFILNSRQSLNDQVSKIDMDGNEICLKNICNCDTLEILMSTELPNYTLLLHISSEGEVFLTDHSAENSNHMGRITNLDFGGILHIEKTDSHIYVRSKVSQNGNQGLLRTSINLDLNSLEIKSNVEWGSKNLLSFDIDEQNNRIAELFSFFNFNLQSDQHIVQIRVGHFLL